MKVEVYKPRRYEPGLPSNPGQNTSEHSRQAHSVTPANSASHNADLIIGAVLGERALLSQVPTSISHSRHTPGLQAYPPKTKDKHRVPARLTALPLHRPTRWAGLTLQHTPCTPQMKPPTERQEPDKVKLLFMKRLFLELSALAR